MISPPSVLAFSRIRLWRAFQSLMVFSAVVAGVVGILCLEMGARARASFFEAEGYRFWANDPSVARRALEAEFLNAGERWTALADRRERSEDVLRLERDILRAHYDARVAESSAKRAYFAYRDVYRLFGRPETRYSRRARLLAPAAKEAWREETRRRGLPVTDLMFDPEPGEEGDHRVVFSTARLDEARRLEAHLRSAGFSVQMMESRGGAGAWARGFILTVSSSEFWEAHASLKTQLAPNLPSFSPKST